MMADKSSTSTKDNAATEYDLPVPLIGLPTPSTGPYKDNTLLYAAGDVVVWAGPPNSATPPLGFEDVSTLGTGANAYRCLGWADVSGYIFKLDETIKDIPAAGVLTPVRSILTGGVKTAQIVFLEALNPYVRSLYDDVPIFPVTTSPLAPPATPPTGLGPNAALYVIPDPPADNRYSLILDSIDGAKRQRLYAPFTKVTARGNDQAQQGDIVMTDMTFTFYPGVIPPSTTPAVAQRAVGYGKSMTAYFT
jgi:hypothetical protein